MKNIFDYIVTLLGNHSCVIVPSLGGFVVNEKVIGTPSDSDFFTPPSKEVIFNPVLTHNDGLLAQEISQTEGVSFDEANSKIISWVSSIKDKIAQNGACEIANYGVFVNKDNRLSFLIKNLHIEDSVHYGLSDFYFPRIRVEKNNLEPSSSGKSHYAWTAAAVATLFLAFQPITNSTHEGTASFSSIVPSDLLVKKEMEQQKVCIEELTNELTLYKGGETLYYWVLNDFKEESEAILFLTENRTSIDDSLTILKLQDRFCVVAASAESTEELELLKNNWKNSPSAYVLAISKFSN
ncbi:MAG: hypothetical protein U0L67_04915 [Paludibacteraceae bacterium]|jgi:hypothetical protein|nr:hypothetical protein [Paludibacteraceae bacterium]